MKKSFKKLTVCMTIICSVLVFASCSEKENIMPGEDSNSPTKGASIQAKIAAMSAEIADFHEAAVFYWRQHLYDTTQIWDETYAYKVLQGLSDLIDKDYDFDYIDENKVLGEIKGSPEKYIKMADISSSDHDAFKSHLMKEYGDFLDISTIIMKTDSIHSRMGQLFVQYEGNMDSLSFEYNNYVSAQLMGVNDISTYAVIHFCADMEYSSAETWKTLFCETFFDRHSYKGDKPKPGFWAKLWDGIKEVVTADVNGIKEGANSVLEADKTAWREAAIAGLIVGAVSSIEKTVEVINNKDLPDPAPAPNPKPEGNE